MTAEVADLGRDQGQSLGRKAAVGFTLTGSAQLVRAVLGFASAIVLARLIAPGEYGVIAMTAPLAGLLALFQSMGLGQAIVQADSLAGRQLNATFWLNVVISVGIALVLLAVSPLVGWFYGDPRPAYATAASAATVLVTGLGVQHRALLNRAMNFTALSVSEVLEAVALFVFSIAIAFVWPSYWALWLGTFLAAVTNCGAAWFFSTWRPGLDADFKSTSKLIRFGLDVTGSDFLGFISRNTDTVLVARFAGTVAVGLYDRSFRLMMFPLRTFNQPLARVMLPILARLRDEPERYRSAFVAALTAISVATLPGVAAAAISSDTLIPILLGHEWAQAAPIFFWLCLAALMLPITNTTGWLFVSSGRTRAARNWALISTPVTLASFVVGLRWGAAGVAAGYFFGQLLLLPALFVWSARGTPIRQSDFYFALAPSALSGVAAWAVLGALEGKVAGLAQVTLAVFLCYAVSVPLQLATPAGREIARRALRMGTAAYAAFRKRAPGLSKARATPR